MKDNQIPKRMKTCLDAGSVEALFPLLKDWSVGELQALMKELEETEDRFNRDIKKETARQILRPEAFFNDRMANIIIEADNKVSMEFLSVCSEIASVAVYYLERHGVTLHSERKTN